MSSPSESDPELPNMVVLKCSDGEKLEVETAVALESPTIKKMILGKSDSDIIDLPGVTSKILEIVVDYCRRHSEVEKKDDEGDTVLVSDSDDELREFDANLLNVDQKTLFDLILAANYLEIESLLDVTCQKVADMIKDMSPEEVRKVFNIKSDYTEEEEKQIHRETAWAYP